MVLNIKDLKPDLSNFAELFADSYLDSDFGYQSKIKDWLISSVRIGVACNILNQEENVNYIIDINNKMSYLYYTTPDGDKDIVLANNLKNGSAGEPSRNSQKIKCHKIIRAILEVYDENLAEVQNNAKKLIDVLYKLNKEKYFDKTIENRIIDFGYIKLEEIKRDYPVNLSNAPFETNNVTFIYCPSEFNQVTKKYWYRLTEGKA